MWNNKNTNQLTEISTLQFISNLHNFVHIISTQSNVAAITQFVSGSRSGRIRRLISSHSRFLPYFKNLNPVQPNYFWRTKNLATKSPKRGTRWSVIGPQDVLRLSQSRSDLMQRLDPPRARHETDANWQDGDAQYMQVPATCVSRADIPGSKKDRSCCCISA